MAIKFVDKESLVYIFTKIKDNFVQKENGKGLSTNDYTTAEKEKLAGIAAGAQVNVLESVKVNGVALSITDKAVDVTVPTKTSDITNDSGFITSADIPEGAAASTTAPKMATETGSVGTEMAFARGDHAHPSDTTRVPVTRTINGKALNADITLAYGDVGAAPATHGHDVATNSASGFMSAADKAKLDTVAEGAQVNAIDTVSTEFELTGKNLSLKAVSSDKVTGLGDVIDGKITALDLAGNYDAKGAAAEALASAKAYTDEKVATANGAAATAQAAAEAAQAAADKAQGEVDALEATVGTVASGKTVVQMIADAQTAATYNDTQVKADIKANADAIDAIEADYLKAADKTELDGKITTNANEIAAIKGDYLKTADKTELTNAIATAKQEAIEAVLDGVTEDYDTLKEVAAWIQSDTTNSAALISRVSAIEADYLKSVDMVALTNSEIDEAFANA